MEKQVGFDYASIPPGYYDEVFVRNRGIQSAWHHFKFAHLRESMPASYDNHLDIGCGAGTFIGTCPAQGTSIGIDIAQDQIAYATDRYATEHHRFECLDILKELPYDDDSFDVVTCIEVIEHLPADLLPRLMQETRRVLRPGGVALITTPNYGSLWPVLERAVNHFGDVTYEDQHISLFKKDSLRTLLEDAEFSDISVTTFQGLAPFVAGLSWGFADSIRRLERPILANRMGFLLLAAARKSPN